MITVRQKLILEWMPLFERFLESENTVIMDCGTLEKAKAARKKYYRVREYYVEEPELHTKFQTVLQTRKAVMFGTSVRFEMHSLIYLESLREIAK